MLELNTARYLDELEAISGTNDRIAFLKDHAYCRDLKAYLWYALNPMKMYHMTKVPEFDINKPYKDKDFCSLFDMLYWLSDKKGITDAEKNLVGMYLHQVKLVSEVRYKWLCKILTKSSIADLGVSTVNRAFGKDFIPKFKCLLMDVIGIKDVKYPVYAQYKYDGFRCIIIPGKGCFGRSGKLIANNSVQKLFSDVCSDQVLDGELYSHKLNFNEIASILRKPSAPLPPSLGYVVYDIVPVNEWEAQKSTQPYVKRIDQLIYLRAYFFRYLPIDLAVTKFVQNEEELRALYAQALENGYEGLVVKNPDSFYEWKRVTTKSGIMAKLKPTDEADGKIIGIFEGKGNIQGQLGGFVVLLDEKIITKVGSGFTKQQRVDYWKEDFEYMGQWVRLKYTEKTPDGNLRFPRFDSFRDDK